MSIRTTVAATGWTQIGTGPGTAQVIAANTTEVMVFAGASQPSTNSDGLVLGSGYPVHNFNLAQPVWAQVVQGGETALMAFQPETT